MLVCKHNGATPIGAPPGWDEQLDGQMGVVYGVPARDLQSGHIFVYTVYQPTPEDLEHLNAGGALRLGTMGGMPVINMAVLGPRVCEFIGVQPAWDMGPPHELAPPDDAR